MEIRLFSFFDPVVTFEPVRQVLRQKQKLPLDTFFDLDGNTINLDSLPQETINLLYYEGMTIYFNIVHHNLDISFYSCLQRDYETLLKDLAEYRKKFVALVKKHEKHEQEPIDGYPCIMPKMSDLRYFRILAGHFHLVHSRYFKENPELVSEVLVLACVVILLEFDNLIHAVQTNETVTGIFATSEIGVAYHELVKGYRDLYDEETEWAIQRIASKARHRQDRIKKDEFIYMLHEHVKTHGTKDIIARFDRPAAEKLGVKPETATKWRQEYNRKNQKKRKM